MERAKFPPIETDGYPVNSWVSRVAFTAPYALAAALFLGVVVHSWDPNHLADAIAFGLVFVAMLALTVISWIFNDYKQAQSN